MPVLALVTCQLHYSINMLHPALLDKAANHIIIVMTWTRFSVKYRALCYSEECACKKVTSHVARLLNNMELHADLHMYIWQRIRTPGPRGGQPRPYKSLIRAL